MFTLILKSLVIVTLTVAIFFGGLFFVRSQYADKSCCRRKATEVTKPAQTSNPSLMLVGMMDGRPEESLGSYSDDFCDCPSSVRWGSCGHNLPFPFGE